MKLIGKIFIKGKIEAKTGLHIGGSKTSLDIGGVDLNVIKTAKGLPFVPGSSFKGKMRSLLAKLEGSVHFNHDSDEIKEIFGDTGSDDQKAGYTRLIVRDAVLDEAHFETAFTEDLELAYSEVKWENTIKRLTGTAENPRQIERVPAGATFDFELVYDVYDDNKEKKHLDKIKKALDLLQDDYLGGHGSRGYGQVSFSFAETQIRKIDPNTQAYGSLEKCDFQF